MKKLLFPFFIFALTTSIFAQGSPEVTVSASVQAAFTVTKNNDVSFGTILENTASTLPADGDPTSPVNVGASYSPGQITLSSLTASTGLHVSWNTDVVLTDGGGVNDTGFTPSIYVSGTNAEDGELTPATGTVINVDGSGTDIVLSIGGQLAAIANPGDYSTANGGNAKPLTVSIVYN